MLPTLDATVTHQSHSDPHHARRIKCRATIDNQLKLDFAYPCENHLVIVTHLSSSDRKGEVLQEEESDSHQLSFALVQSTQLSSLTDRHDDGSRSPSMWELLVELWAHYTDPSDSWRNHRVKLRPVMSVGTLLRQMNGLIRLHTSQLVRDILHPRGGVYFGQSPGHRPHSSPSEVHTMVST